MKLFNSLSRKKELFRPLRDRRVGLYTCGPTVYNYAHIGNLRTYIFEDVLERALTFAGYRVERVMNVTDVGHLTSDADQGEDKMDKGAKREGKTVWDIARFYTRAFFKDLAALNARKPATVAPATKFVGAQIRLVERLFAKGYAYETAKAVYFDVSKFKNYQKLSRQKLSEKATGARQEVVKDPEKRNLQDFALWFKLVGRFAHHIMRWPSPWGIGFPGWHIECSAISTHFLGQPFDIHTGGIDHIPLHHTNEIAQSEAAEGKPLARYWMHGEFLVLGEKRMGKSEQNFITLGTLMERGFHPLAYRYFTLTAHYRSPLNFTWEALRGAAQAYEKLLLKLQFLAQHRGDGTRTRRAAAREFAKVAAAFAREFARAVRDDLNTPQALAALQRAVGTLITRHAALPLPPAIVGSFFKEVSRADEVLGLNLTAFPPIPRNVRKLAEERELYRRSKQFAHADVLRKKTEALGYKVHDTPFGPVITSLHGHRKGTQTPAAKPRG